MWLENSKSDYKILSYVEYVNMTLTQPQITHFLYIDIVFLEYRIYHEALCDVVLLSYWDPVRNESPWFKTPSAGQICLNTFILQIVFIWTAFTSPPHPSVFPCTSKIYEELSSKTPRNTRNNYCLKFIIISKWLITPSKTATTVEEKSHINKSSKYSDGLHFYTSNPFDRLAVKVF